MRLKRRKAWFKCQSKDRCEPLSRDGCAACRGWENATRCLCSLRNVREAAGRMVNTRPACLCSPLKWRFNGEQAAHKPRIKPALMNLSSSIPMAKVCEHPHPGHSWFLPKWGSQIRPHSNFVFYFGERHVVHAALRTVLCLTQRESFWLACLHGAVTVLVTVIVLKPSSSKSFGGNNQTSVPP